MLKVLDQNVKKELLKHFGSVKKLKEATLEQLEEVLPKEVAKIYLLFYKTPNNIIFIYYY